MQILKGHRKVVQSIAFSQDGQMLASGSGDRTVRLWELTTGQVRVTWEGHGVMGNKVAFSPDRRWLAAVHNHRVRIYDLNTLKEVQVLGEDDPSGSAQAIAFAPDGKELVVGGTHGAWERWRIWKLPSWKEAQTPPVAAKIDHVCNLSFAPGGSLLAVLGYSEMLLCNPRDGSVNASCPVQTRGTGSAMPLAFSPDGHLLVFGHASSLVVWDVEANKAIRQLTQPKKHFQDAGFSPDGRILATVSNEETVRYWDARSGKETRTFAWEAGKPKCIAFAADGMRAAVGTDKGKIVVWDVDA